MKKEVNNWKKKIAFFLTSQSISLFGSSIVQFAIIWYITLETKSGVMMTLATVCGFVPQILIGLFAGVWADRFNKKYIIMLADGFIALFALIIAVLFLNGINSIYILLIVMALRSFGSGIQTPAVSSIIPELTPKKNLIRVNGINTTIQSLMMVLSPVVSGALLASISLGYILFVDVITAILGIFVFSRVKYEFKKKESNGKIDYFKEIKEGIVYTKNHKLISHILIYIVALSIIITPISTLTPLMVTRSFGDSAWYLTANEIVFFIGSIIGGIVISAWGGFKNKIKTVSFACILCGLFSALMGMPFGFTIYLVFMGLIGVMCPMFNTPLVTLLQEVVEPEKIGRIFSLVTIVTGSTLPLAMLFFGPLADVIKIEYILIVTGFVFMIVSFLILKDKKIKANYVIESE